MQYGQSANNCCKLYVYECVDIIQTYLLILKLYSSFEMGTQQMCKCVYVCTVQM